MQFSLIFKTIGLLLMVFSFTQLPPIIVDIIYSEQQYPVFLIALLITLVSGLLLWLPFRKLDKDFRIREGILIVVSFWIVLSLFATIPFLLTDSLNISFSDAFFCYYRIGRFT
jgi:trk system potassium uptake protein TrkH